MYFALLILARVGTTVTEELRTLALSLAENVVSLVARSIGEQVNPVPMLLVVKVETFIRALIKSSCYTLTLTFSTDKLTDI